LSKDYKKRFKTINGILDFGDGSQRSGIFPEVKMTIIHPSTQGVQAAVICSSSSWWWQLLLQHNLFKFYDTSSRDCSV